MKVRRAGRWGPPRTREQPGDDCLLSLRLASYVAPPAFSPVRREGKGSPWQALRCGRGGKTSVFACHQTGELQGDGFRGTEEEPGDAVRHGMGIPIFAPLPQLAGSGSAGAFKWP